MHELTPILIGAAALGIITGTSLAQQSRTIVNGIALSPQEVAAISYRVGQPLLPGRFWYDTISGMWGYEGGPVMGQLPPNMSEIRGELKADASGGQSEVFINGRAVHPATLAQLQMMYGSQVPPGRYGMDAYGQIVIEGQPFPPVGQGYAQSGPQNTQGGWGGGNSVYMPGRTSSGAADGLHVGKASDGCTYIVTGDYSAESC